MKPPAIRRHNSSRFSPADDRGVTIILVAISMVGILAMAALSIDVITLYLARLEAQRSADAAALTAARIISLSGITGDPSNATGDWAQICGGETSPASQAAQAVAYQNTVGGLPATTITVKYFAGAAAPTDDCSSLPQAFGVNPMVTVQVTRTGLPSLFSRMWKAPSSSVTTTATAEAFNPSNSGNVDNGPTGTITPVQPRCVKPWVVPNLDPLAGLPLVSRFDGSIQNKGISLNGLGSSGVIGENFWLVPDCNPRGVSPCGLAPNPPIANIVGGGRPNPNLQYLPGATSGTGLTAIPSCTQGALYEEAIEGCQPASDYQCGVLNQNPIDLTENPSLATDDTANGVQCLIHQKDTANAPGAQPSGQDTLTPYAGPSSYPFQISAGSKNPFIAGGTPITSSVSIVSLPIYDIGQVYVPGNPAGYINPTGTTNVTVVGFLQVFINATDAFGDVDVTILNVAGCGNGTNPTGNAVTGSSPVPVRLITPP